MTKKEKLADLLEKMKKLSSDNDYERAHGEADAILCEYLDLLGHKEIVEAYDKVGMWYA